MRGQDEEEEQVARNQHQPNPAKPNFTQLDQVGPLKPTSHLQLATRGRGTAGAGIARRTLRAKAPGRSSANHEARQMQVTPSRIASGQVTAY
jgi:hypothetical protein